MFKRWFNIDQDENDAGGGAGGGSGSQDGGDAGKGDADAAAAAAAQAEKDKGSSGSAGNDGTPPKPAWEKDSIVWNGQQKELTRQEIINYAQQAFNVTQREQAASKKWKEASAKDANVTARLEYLEKLIADADKKGGDGEDDGQQDPPDPIKELTGKFQTLEQRQEKRELRQQWNEAFLPIKQKFPGIDEDKVNDSFTEKVKSGEVEDSERGLMTAAEEVAKADAAEKKTAEDKQIETLLTKADDPRLKAFIDKEIAKYVADKAKNKNAGGDSGAGGGGGGQAKKDAGSISEIAAKIRESIPT